MNVKPHYVRIALGILSLIAFALLISSCNSNPPESNLEALERDLTRISMECGNSVVVVDARPSDHEAEEADSGECKHRIGSGFIYRSDGYIVTTDAVLGEAENIKIITQDGVEHPATLVGRDFETNIAVLKTAVRDFTPISLPEQDNSSNCVGLMIGNTYFSEGIICSWGLLNRTRIGGGDFLDHKLFSMHIAVPEVPSGTPIVDARGDLFGITEGHLEDDKYVWTIIPAATITSVAQRLIADGAIQRGWLGIKSDQQCTRSDIVNLIQEWKGKGVVISDVLADSPAEKARLQSGDIISAVDDTPVTCVYTLREKITSLAPGTDVVLKLIRGGEEMTVKCTLGTLTIQPDRHRRCPNRDL